MTAGTPAWTRPAEIWLTAVSAIILAVPAAGFAAAAFEDTASPKFQGAVAAVALSCLATLASILVGFHSHAGAFMLRAPVLVLVYPLGNLIGQWALPVLLVAAVPLLFSVILLVLRLMESEEQRSVSHLER